MMRPNKGWDGGQGKCSAWFSLFASNCLRGWHKFLRPIRSVSGKTVQSSLSPYAQLIIVLKHCVIIILLP